MDEHQSFEQARRRPTAASLEVPARPVFIRSDQNPILTARDLPFRASAVLNPGATEHDGDVVLLLRVEQVSGYSDIHVARSRNGVTGWHIEPEPLIAHGDPEYTYEEWGCEDARVVYIPGEERWYITYVAYSSMGPAVGLAWTDDFRTAHRIALLGSTNDKDGVLFPRKFGERYCMLHRPDAGGQEHIWSTYSSDLIGWGEPHCVMFEGIGPAWDHLRIGAGPPPIETEQGWLLIYHGVKAYGGKLIYRCGLALLERHRPHKLVARTPGWVFQAEAPYELSGFGPNAVFPTGLLQRGDDLWMYYGAADTYVCLATARLSELMGLLVEAHR
ncbi:MAG: glycosidase [Phycisphaeraceae bacterium]